MSRTKHILSYSIPIVILLFFLFGSFFAPHDPTATNIRGKYLSSSAEYPFGTDDFGRCEFSRILEGGKITLGIVLVGSAIVILLGIVFGILLAKTGRRRNILAESILNAVTAIPPVAYLIIFIGIWGNSIPTMLVALTASLVLRMMNSGDLEIAQGQILLDGDNLLIHGAKERRALCGKTIGFIPQNPMTAFFPHAKMERQIIETLRMHTGLDKKQAHALAENVLRQVNLTDTKRVLSAYPGELSGGMLQRIAMALILGTKPKYVLADEPTSALDEANRDLLLELLRKYQKTAAILFISHDTEAMKALCPITHVMERGKIIETQATEQLFIHPQQPWTKRFAEAACHREEVNWKWTALN